MQQSLPSSHLNFFQLFSIHPLECPRIIYKIVLDSILQTLVWNHDINVNLFTRHWIKVAINLKVPQDLAFFVSEPT